MKCPICFEEMVYDSAEEEWICPGEKSLEAIDDTVVSKIIEEMQTDNTPGS